MLQELIETRHIQPQARHYEALILSNCESRRGSAKAIYPILAEMEHGKIGIGHSTASAVLKVLSIHPDHQLLTSILQTMSSKWIVPTTVDTSHTILALTRLNQFERALPHLENLILTSKPPDNNLQSPVSQSLYLTILYRLASPSISDYTAILHLLYLLTEHNLPISNVCISYLLDTAAEALHLDLTLYLWRSHIDTNYIIPHNGLCRNALLTAAKNPNSELATKAARVLETRGYQGGADEKEGRTGGAGDGLGLQVEEVEMVREAFMGDIDEETGKMRLGVQAVDKLTNRIYWLRWKERRREETRERRRQLGGRTREREKERGRGEGGKRMVDGKMSVINNQQVSSYKVGSQ